MRITIGEIANELIEYSNSVEVNIMNGVPFLRARISSISNFTRCYMYVIQTAEHTYAVCDSHDDLNGERFFPSGEIIKPFILERDIIRLKFGIESSGDFIYGYESVVQDLPYEEFMNHLLKRMHAYEIIKFDPINLSSRISNLGFTNPRLRRCLDNEFTDKKHHKGTISDLIDIVLRQRKKFSLAILKPREMGAVAGKLKDLGIYVIIDDDKCIVDLKFNKCPEG